MSTNDDFLSQPFLYPDETRRRMTQQYAERIAEFNGNRRGTKKFAKAARTIAALGYESCVRVATERGLVTRSN